jgi:hypothetical protein
LINVQGKPTLLLIFSTFTLPFFTELHSKGYRKVEGKNVKVLPENIAELLTPRALAYCLAGEGGYDKSRGAIRIATHSFTPEEVDQLRAALLNNFNIESSRNVYGKAKASTESVSLKENYLSFKL